MISKLVGVEQHFSQFFRIVDIVKLGFPTRVTLVGHPTWVSLFRTILSRETVQRSRLHFKVSLPLVLFLDFSSHVLNDEL